MGVGTKQSASFLYKGFQGNLTMTFAPSCLQGNILEHVDQRVILLNDFCFRGPGFLAFEKKKKKKNNLAPTPPHSLPLPSVSSTSDVQED